MPWKVEYFCTSRGDSPVKTFIDAQREMVKAKIIETFRLLEVSGPFLHPPYAKKIEKDLYELRIRGSLAIRIFYTIKQGKCILLHAMVKKTEKIPHQELQVAVDRMLVVI